MKAQLHDKCWQPNGGSPWFSYGLLTPQRVQDAFARSSEDGRVKDPKGPHTPSKKNTRTPKGKVESLIRAIIAATWWFYQIPGSIGPAR